MIRLLAALSCLLLVVFRPVAAQTTPPAAADSFEVDNSKATAKSLAVNSPQSHNFHIDNDIDYLKFDLAPGTSLTITFTPASTQYGERWRADLTEEVMGTSFSRGTQTFGSAARTLNASSTFPVTTTFYLRITKNLAVYPGRAFSGMPSSYTVRAASASGNMPPYVSVTSPGAGSNHPAGGPVTLAATASDPDDPNQTVNRVEFLINGQEVGEDTTPGDSFSYSYTWVPTVIGNHTFIARAVDNGGLPTESPPRTIVVSQGPQAPTVTLQLVAPATSPFKVGKPIPLLATAADGDGYITRVEFYENGRLLETLQEGPYNYVWRTAPVGTHTLTARAFSDTDQSTLSAPLQVVVNPNQPPTVALTVSPNGSSYALGQAFALSATASDSDGAVQWVEFFANNNSLTKDFSSPYGHTWTPSSAGTYVLQARTIDEDGAPGESPTTTITITPPGGGSNFEPNDTPETASPYSSVQQHDFHSSADRDWITYSLAANQGSTVTIAPVAGQASPRWEARLYLRESGAPIPTTPIRTAQMSSQAIVWSGLNSLAALGRAYYIQVLPLDGQFNGSQSAYTVTMVGAPFGGASNCYLGDWSSLVGTPVAGEPDDSLPVPRYRGRCGIQADSMGEYLVDDSPNSESAYNVRFYYYTGNRSAGTADIFQARSASAALIRVTHDGSQLGFSINGTATTRAVAVADNRWYAIQLGWTSGATASTGAMTISVIGAGSATPISVLALVGASNASDRIDEIRLGLVSGAGSGAVGFDDFESRRFSMPPRRCRGDANNDGAITIADLASIAAEINTASQSYAPGQPDANEDGSVDQSDLSTVNAAIAAGLTCNQM